MDVPQNWTIDFEKGKDFSDSTDPKAWADYPVNFRVKVPNDNWWQLCIERMNLPITLQALTEKYHQTATSRSEVDNRIIINAGYQLLVDGHDHMIYNCTKRNRKRVGYEHQGDQCYPIRRAQSNDDKINLLCECVAKGMNQEWFVEQTNPQTAWIKREDPPPLLDTNTTLLHEWASLYNARINPVLIATSDDRSRSDGEHTMQSFTYGPSTLDKKSFIAFTSKQAQALERYIQSRQPTDEDQMDPVADGKIKPFTAYGVRTMAEQRIRREFVNRVASKDTDMHDLQAVCDDEEIRLAIFIEITKGILDDLLDLPTKDRHPIPANLVATIPVINDNYMSREQFDQQIGFGSPAAIKKLPLPGDPAQAMKAEQILQTYGDSYYELEPKLRQLVLKFQGLYFARVNLRSTGEASMIFHNWERMDEINQWARMQAMRTFLQRFWNPRMEHLIAIKNKEKTEADLIASHRQEQRRDREYDKRVSDAKARGEDTSNIYKHEGWKGWHMSTVGPAERDRRAAAAAKKSRTNFGPPYAQATATRPEARAYPSVSESGLKRAPRTEDEKAQRRADQDEDDRLRKEGAEGLDKWLLAREHELASRPDIHHRQVKITDFNGVEMLPSEMSVAIDLTRTWPSFYDETNRNNPHANQGFDGPPRMGN